MRMLTLICKCNEFFTKNGERSTNLTTSNLIPFCWNLLTELQDESLGGIKRGHTSANYKNGNMNFRSKWTRVLRYAATR